MSYPDFLDLRKQSGAFEEMAVYRETQSIVLTGQGEPERLHGVIVSANLFDILGEAPALGRGFLDDRNQLTKEKVVVLSHEMWSTRFHSDPHVLGRSIALDGSLYSIVGVMPVGFQFPISAEPVALWVSTAFDGSMAARAASALITASHA